MTESIKAQPTLQLNDSSTEIFLGKYFGVLEDPNSKLNINDVIKDEYQQKYKFFNQNSPSLGFSNSTFWIKIKIQNNSTQKYWILDQSFANSHYLDLYIKNNKGNGYTIKKSGNLTPFKNRDISHRRILFKLPINIGETNTFYLRYKNQASANLDFRLWSESSFSDYDRVESFWLGIFYGLLMTIIIINLTLYIFFRNRSYRFLVLFLISIGTTFLFYDGYGQMLFSENYAKMSEHAIPMSIALAMIALLYFVQAMLSTTKSFMVIHSIFVIFWVLLFLTNPFISYLTAIAISLPLLFLTLLYLLAIGFTHWNKQKTTARIIVIGLLSFFIGYTLLSMMHFGNLERSFFYEQGMRTGFIILLLFMSTQKISEALNRSETQQHQSEEKFSKIFYDQPIAMQTIDLETAQRIDVNNYFCKLFEYNREELLSTTAYELNLWENQQAQEDAYRKLLAQGSAHNEPLKVRTQSGTILDVLVNASVLHFENRKLAIISIIDVTVNKKISDELKFSNDKFFKIFQSSPSSIIMAEIDTGLIVEVNQTFENTFGYSTQNLKGKTTFDINLWKNSDDRIRLMDLMNNEDFGHEEKLELLDQSGNTILVNSHFFKIQIKHKKYTISTLLDITQQNRTEQTIRDIAIGFSAEIGESFFQQLVLQLAKVFDADYVFIALTNDSVVDTLETMVMCSHGKIADNFSYNLRGTPCGTVLGHKLCSYPQDVQVLFPDDHLLAEMNVQSYVGAPMFNEQGDPIGLIVLMDSKPLQKSSQVIDILQIFSARAASEIIRSQSDTKLKHTQQSLELHVEQTPLAVIQWNTNFEVVSWNPSAERIFGYTKKEAIGKSAQQIIVPEQHVTMINEKWQTLLTNKGTSKSHYQNITKNGQFIICDWYNTTLVTEDGNVIGVISLAADVTAEEQSQLALINKQKEQSEILNSTFDGIITINQTGQILTFNKAAENLFGYTSEEILGRNVRKLMPLQTASQHDGYLQRYIETGVATIIGVPREVVALRKDKTTFPMRLSLAELSSDKRGNQRFIGSCQDLTLIKQQEEQLRRSQKMDALGKLTGGIAHDFNNLLGVILGYSDLLEKSLEEQPKQSRYAHQIKRAGERGAKLTKKLLSFSRIRSGQFSPVNINTVVLNQRHLLEKMLTARITVSLDLEDKLWTVELDESGLEDIILNISINAMHAIEGNGQLTLQTLNKLIETSAANILQIETGEYIMFNITDTGHGMDKETVDKIFDPFFSTKGEKGTGLGLSQVYGFVKSCGGAIKVYSEPQHGTQFTLYFPRHQESTNKQKSTKPTKNIALNGTETILVVDDEPSLRELSQEILTQKGYKVLCAEKPSDALEILQTTKVDLLLSDVIMPEMDGYQLATLVESKYPQIKIQLASGFTDDRHENIKNDKHHKQLLKKPFTPETLLLKIRQLLDDKGLNTS